MCKVWLGIGLLLILSGYSCHIWAIHGKCIEMDIRIANFSDEKQVNKKTIL